MPHLYTYLAEFQPVTATSSARTARAAAEARFIQLPERLKQAKSNLAGCAYLAFDKVLQLLKCFLIRPFESQKVAFEVQRLHVPRRVVQA